MRHSMMMISVLGLAGLAACAPTGQWVNPSVPKSQWAADQSECRRYAEDAAGTRSYDYDTAGPGTMTRAERYNDAKRERAYMTACMTGKGYLPKK